MLRSLTRSQAIAKQRVSGKADRSRKIRKISIAPDDQAETDVAARIEALVQDENDLVPEQDEQSADFSQDATDSSDARDLSEDVRARFDDDDDDLDLDIETIEGSGPGQFLIRRNAELLDALFGLHGEVEALRRVVENGKDTAADRIVRAIDRADVAAAARAKGGRRLLGLLAILNIALLALGAYALWPLSFLPVPAL